jgi:hypothetical protein
MAPIQAVRRAPRLSLARPIGNQAMLRRTPCDDAKTCAKPITGDPDAFIGSVEGVESARRDTQSKAAPGSEAAKLKGRHGERATNLENILKAHGIPLGPEMAGFFLDSGMSADEDGAATGPCSGFPNGPPGAPPVPADKFCTQLPPQTVDQAKALDGKMPLSEKEKKDVAWLVAMGVHEMRHASFDKVQTDPDLSKRTIKDEAGCALDDKVGGVTVELLLSEITAETSEFPVYYKNLVGMEHHTPSLIKEERDIAIGSGESILGAIKKLRCQCPCASVENLVVNTVNQTIAGWPADQKLAYLQAMTRIMPSYWPKSLQRKE